MTHSHDAAFRENIENFLVRTGMSASRFGELAGNDRNLVADLRSENREFKRSTIEKVEKWIAGYETGLSDARDNRAGLKPELTGNRDAMTV